MAARSASAIPLAFVAGFIVSEARIPPSAQTTLLGFLLGRRLGSRPDIPLLGIGHAWMATLVPLMELWLPTGETLLIDALVLAIVILPFIAATAAESLALVASDYGVRSALLQCKKEHQPGVSPVASLLPIRERLGEILINRRARPDGNYRDNPLRLIQRVHDPKAPHLELSVRGKLALQRLAAAWISRDSANRLLDSALQARWQVTKG